jgi:dihydropteroate synthase
MRRRPFCRRFFIMPRLDAFRSLLGESRTLIMGVLNVTPDSFSDGGDYLASDAARKRAEHMIAEGADIIDIGGQSTRPPGKTYGAGAAEVTEDEERRRVIPLIETLTRDLTGTLYSIDTVRASIAREAIEAGADIINDVSAGTSDTNMFQVAADLQAPIILMHGYGPEFTKEKIEEYHYGNVTDEVVRWLQQRVGAADSMGIPIVLADCGFGFAKRAEDNIRLLQEHSKFTFLNVPIVLGVSRKSTIGKMLGADVPPKERLYGSIGAAVYGALNGAKVIRTHDVLATKQALQVVDAIRNPAA